MENIDIVNIRSNISILIQYFKMWMKLFEIWTIWCVIHSKNRFYKNKFQIAKTIKFLLPIWLNEQVKFYVNSYASCFFARNTKEGSSSGNKSFEIVSIWSRIIVKVTIDIEVHFIVFIVVMLN